MSGDIFEKGRKQRWDEVRSELVGVHPSEAARVIEELPETESTAVFRLLPHRSASEIFGYLDLAHQQQVIRNVGPKDVAVLLNELPPDDRTRFLEKLPDPILKEILNLLSPAERDISSRLLGYAEDTVGRLMTPDYISVKKDWTVSQTLEHIRSIAQNVETLNIIYVVDENNRLIDHIRIGSFLVAEPDALVEELMGVKFVALLDTLDKEDAVQIFRQYDRSALPVITENGTLVGIVTVDDILDVAEAAATEDIQKFGGLEALELPYTETPMLQMIKKRASWLIVLFFGEMLTASAMGYFEEEIASAVVLALFVPLIISSGGNSGSQAATLIIRAMALKEVTVRDWWLVMRREVLSGFTLGLLLGSIGFVRIAIWQKFGLFDYTEHWTLVGFTIFLSLIAIVMWGTLSGSMIPFLLRRLKVDPATSSAPFVATLVDVTGIVIYFSIAAIILRGTLL